ncbi:MAG: TaqI-like C-terminal specificity domain-containing protein [Paludibacter sp.]
MSLFQTQVERQFLAGITTDLTPIYKKYVDYFGNPAIQANILELIEQQYQGEFIEALFVNILGYTAQPQPNFNLLREKKNETDAKSADAAISINNQIVGVIELKDHKTQDLKKVEVQAFGYKNNHKNCHYVVTSNFERLRFYIDNAVDFIEFDLFNLTFDEFRRLWLCLSYESMEKNLPQEIKNQSISNEDVITKQLYKDYSIFKRQLFDSIVTLNPDFDKLLLFKKTQKLLDRFLFLFFAEDKELLPANSVKGTVDKWKKFNFDPMNDYQSLYSRFVKYFKLLDVGYKDASTEIYAYNGGLFANDDLLNQIKVDDTILSENVLKLAVYDYDTDVDVNILGHIFENSLNEIEQVANEISTGEKTTSKRKQDGVFYTPRYITQYIVENTVGRLCEEKKTELGIGEELFEYKTPAKRKKAVKVFDDYREWLLHISIVDPACGSGAFLNTALDFLIAEHKWIDNQQDKITGSKDHYSMGLSNIENTILENNLFGVDINEESVEIAKLSLWLRTAKPHRKLSSLNNNIKCGNSLIDDPAVAGEKAFDWYKEFPQVFGREQKTAEVITLEKDKTPDYLKLIKEKSAEAQLKAEQGIALSKEALEISKQLAEYANKLEAVSAPKPSYEKLKGGFDVVIGNPPYGATVNNSTEKAFYNSNYKTRFPNYDTYGLFFERANHLLKKSGLLGFITPNTYLVIENGLNLRKFLFENWTIHSLLETFNVFPDAVVEPLTIILSKNKAKLDYTFTCFLLPRGLTLSQVSLSTLTELNFKYSDLFEREDLIFNYRATLTNKLLSTKIAKKAIKFSDISKICAGVKPYEKGKGFPPQSAVIVENKPYTSHEKQGDDWLKLIRGTQVNRYSLTWDGEYIKYGECLAAPRNSDSFFSPKLFIRRTDDRILAVYDDEKIVGLNSIHCLQAINKDISLKFLLSILNSKLINWYFQFQNFHMVGKPLAEVKVVFIERLPLIVANNQQPYIQNVDKIVLLNKNLNEASQKFQRMLQRKFELNDLPGKLQNWYMLTYKEFIAELGKKKVKLTLAQESEWEDYFNMEKAKALEIKKQIDDTDREIDRMVYTLYELTDEEVKIVEGK